ncbi:MAG TPA: acyl-CoA dehydrogenase family protein [Nocardioidaceae bacterium]|nr:acyl-CoA dehydrogenase family protein [Nocardioidaceae bacterium]
MTVPPDTAQPGTAEPEAAAPEPAGAGVRAEDGWPIPDSRGINRYQDDPAMSALLDLYLEQDLRRHVEPVLVRLGRDVGSRLDDLAHEADRNPPTLTHRRRDGRDEQAVRKHPAYQELERFAFAELGLAAMSHVPGVLGWPAPLPHQVKYALTFLFTQAEFGVLCPVNMTDSLTRTLRRYGSTELVDSYLGGLTSTDFDSLSQGAMFMTEQQAGSDIAQTATVAQLQPDGSWSLTGDKWFCSNVDAEVALVLARPEGAQAGIRGVALFLLPRHRADGSRNAYRVIRLKEKLGTRSMASGEIVLEGATAYLVGDPGQGFKQMADMVNSSRLSNGVRAAGLMRRAFAEARYVSLHREAFGRRLVDLPLQRRQLVKLLLPAEQARSMYLHIAQLFPAADAGDATAASLIRILTPLIKFRACRDARRVAGDAMEARGGVGYIEEYGDARLVRDSHLGSIWEGTSNIVALDVARAAHRAGCLPVLVTHLKGLLGEPSMPAPVSAALAPLLDRVAALVERLDVKDEEAATRQVASALYHLTSAIVMSREAVSLAAAGHGWGRLALAGLVVRHRLAARDPLEPAVDDASLLHDLVLERPVSRGAAVAVFECLTVAAA